MPAINAHFDSNLRESEGGSVPVTPSYNNISSISDSVMTLQDLLAVLARHKLLIFLTMTSILLFTIQYTLSIKPSYRANAIVQIEREGAQIVDFGQTRKVSGGFDVEKDPFFRTRYEMLKGRVLSQGVIEELDLFDSLNPKNEQKVFSISEIKKLLGLSADTTRNISMPADYNQRFSNNLNIEPIPGTHLVKVFYEAPSAEEAKVVVTTLLNNFIKLQIETKSVTGEYAKKFLSKQLIESGERLRKGERALVQYANKNGILEVDDKQTRHIKNLENLDAALMLAEIKRIETESLYLQIKKSGSVSTVLTNTVISGLKARLYKMEGDYQKLLKTLKPQNLKVVSLQQQIFSARSKIKKELRNIQTSMKADYLAAKRQEERIRDELDLFKKEMNNLQESSLEYNKLKREVESSEKLYSSLQQRLEEVNVASAANTSSISIVEPAIIPFDKYRPRMKLNLIIATFFGLTLSIGLVFLRESLKSQSINSFEELERKFSLPVLGRIPRIRKRSIKKQLDMIISKVPYDPVSEAYQILAANVQLMLGNVNDRVVLITSVFAAEGKSVTALNIASAYALMGKRVLLIDADIRKPSLHKKTSLSNETGLSDYLKGETNIEGITQPVNSIQGLFIITAGKVESDPVSLLSNVRMKYLVKQGTTIFDYVIIDGPPVVGFADTLLLSSIATSTLIVAQEKKLDAGKINFVLKKLERVKKNIIGFSLINVKDPEAGNKYYFDYRERLNQSMLIGRY